MKLDDFYKAEYFLREIKKNEVALHQIQKLFNQQKHERISDDDIKWLLKVAHEGSIYIKRDLEEQFNKL